MIFELAQDFHDAVAAMPTEHPKHRMLELLEEAIRRDIHFIDRHPTTLFQCMWNTCWWYDAPGVGDHYEGQDGFWNHEVEKLYPLLECWRSEKRAANGGVERPWLRSARPPPLELGTALRMIFRGHTDSVVSVILSPDGRTLASGGGNRDKTIKLWDVASGQLKASLGGHVAPICCVTFSPDGHTLASGSADRTIRLWDVASGQFKASLRGHTGRVSSVSFSPDGRTLASGGSGDYEDAPWGPGDTEPPGQIILWNVASRQLIAFWEGHADEINSVSFSPDGRTLASGSDDQAVKLWDVKSGMQIASMEGHAGRVFCVSFSPDGRTLASGSADRTIKLWDVERTQIKASLEAHTSSIWCLTFSPDGHTLASGSADQTIKLWDAERAQIISAFEGHTCGVNSVCYSTDGHALASGGGHHDRTVMLWDVASERPKASLEAHTSSIWCLTFSPDGHTLASASIDGAIKLWDVESGICLETRESSYYAESERELRAQVGWAAPSRSCSLLTRCDWKEGDTAFLNSSTRQPLARYPAEFKDITQCPNGRLIAGVTHANPDQVCLLWLEGDIPR